MQVLIFPEEESQFNNESFLKLVYSQIKQMIREKLWVVGLAQLCILTAYQCGVEFGAFDETTHEAGFLQSKIGNELNVEGEEFSQE